MIVYDWLGTVNQPVDERVTTPKFRREALADILEVADLSCLLFFVRNQAE